MKTNDPVTQWEKKVMEKMFHLSQIKDLEKKIINRWGHPAVTDMTYLNMVFSDEYENLTKHVNKILQINRWLEKWDSVEEAKTA